MDSVALLSRPCRPHLRHRRHQRLRDRKIARNLQHASQATSQVRR